MNIDELAEKIAEKIENRLAKRLEDIELTLGLRGESSAFYDCLPDIDSLRAEAKDQVKHLLRSHDVIYISQLAKLSRKYERLCLADRSKIVNELSDSGHIIKAGKKVLSCIYEAD